MTDRNLNDFTDEELMLEFQSSSDEKAFEILVQRFRNPLINFVFRFLGDYDSSTDVVQETFVKVFRYKDNYNSVAKFSTWVYTIAGNLAKTEYRRKQRRNFFSINNYGEESKNFDIPDNSLRPDKVVDATIKNEIIQKALLKVRQSYREAVILRDIQELSYEEIAEIMQIEIGTVKSRINRGRAELQKYLEHIYEIDINNG